MAIYLLKTKYILGWLFGLVFFGVFEVVLFEHVVEVEVVVGSLVAFFVAHGKALVIRLFKLLTFDAAA